MTTVGEPVKGKTEAGRRREEQARLRRQRVVDAALRLFLERGYVATTIEAIAREAAVAPATVYQAFGSKQAILARILDATIAGDTGPAALLERGWVRQASQDPDPRQRLALVIQHTSGVAARTAPIKEVMRDAAAADPAVRQLLREDDQRRQVTQRTLIDLVIGSDSLRAGCDRDHAAATYRGTWAHCAWERQSFTDPLAYSITHHPVIETRGLCSHATIGIVLVRDALAQGVGTGNAVHAFIDQFAKVVNYQGLGVSHLPSTREPTVTHNRLVRRVRGFFSIEILVSEFGEFSDHGCTMVVPFRN